MISRFARCWKPGGRWAVVVGSLGEIVRFRSLSAARHAARKWNHWRSPMQARVVRWRRDVRWLRGGRP